MAVWGLRKRFHHSALGIARADRPSGIRPTPRGGRGGGGGAWGHGVGRRRGGLRAVGRGDRGGCGDGEGSSRPGAGCDHSSPATGSNGARIGWCATSLYCARWCAAPGGNARPASTPGRCSPTMTPTSPTHVGWNSEGGSTIRLWASGWRVAARHRDGVSAFTEWRIALRASALRGETERDRRRKMAWVATSQSGGIRYPWGTAGSTGPLQAMR